MGGFFDAAQGAGPEGRPRSQFVAGLPEADSCRIIKRYHLFVFYIIIYPQMELRILHQ